MRSRRRSAGRAATVRRAGNADRSGGGSRVPFCYAREYAEADPDPALPALRRTDAADQRLEERRVPPLWLQRRLLLIAGVDPRGYALLR